MTITKYITTFICLLSAPLALASMPVNESYQSFRNINIVDVEKGTVNKNNFLIIRGKNIEYVGASLPQQYFLEKTQDAKGVFVIPGLIDTHAHISLGEVTFKKIRGKLAINAHNSDDISSWNAAELLNWGVTYIRNPGGSSQHNVHYKNQIASGEIIGPGAKVAGELLDTNIFDGLTVNIDENMTLAKAIQQQKNAGVDIIKLYSGLSEQQVKEAIKIAHNLNMKVAGHLDDVSWTDAANWQIDSLVHAMPGSEKLLDAQEKQRYINTSRPGTFAFFEWYENLNLNSKPMIEMYQALRENKVYVDPTLIVFKNTFFGNRKDIITHPQLSKVHPELLNNWKTFFTFNLGWKEDDFIRAQKVWPKVLQFVNRLHQEGVLLTIGSDLGNPWVIPGLSVHQEMQLFSEAGISNQDIIRMATVNAAKQLNIFDTQGTIEKGKIANLVFLKKNPFEDIANTQSISQVYLLGKQVHRNTDNSAFILKPQQ
ncbi:amidohydrolase family protein [Thalassotalea agariperforans]